MTHSIFTFLLAGTKKYQDVSLEALRAKKAGSKNIIAFDFVELT
jgi:hypothetical protein